jgi:hypothetical protein
MLVQHGTTGAEENMPKTKYTVVSLFSGGMGLDLGLNQA